MEEEEERVVRAVIAGASEALRFKGKNPKVFDDDVMRFVTLNAEKIAKNVD